LSADLVVGASIVSDAVRTMRLLKIKKVYLLDGKIMPPPKKGKDMPPAVVVKYISRALSMHCPYVHHMILFSCWNTSGRLLSGITSTNTILACLSSPWLKVVFPSCATHFASCAVSLFLRSILQSAQGSFTKCSSILLLFQNCLCSQCSLL
jgi:hypothetical protein